MNRSKKTNSVVSGSKIKTPVVKKAVAKVATKVATKIVVLKKAPVKKKVEVEQLRKVTLSLSVPETAAVFVAGDFNDWKPTELKMKKRGKGVFAVQLALKPGQYEYKFLVDGQWQHDPACSESVANPFGSFNSLLIVE